MASTKKGKEVKEKHVLLRRWRLMVMAVGVGMFLMAIFHSLPTIWNYFDPPPFLCRKDGIHMHCPLIKDPPSLWENPKSALADWRPCAEETGPNYLSPAGEDGGNGFLGINAEGGLNQQRVSIMNAVAVARIMNCTLILPLFKQDSIWKDTTQFEDVYDVDHFINYLKDDVRILREVPDWVPNRKDLYTSIRLTVKNIPKYAGAAFYLDNVLPRIKDKKLMALKPFVDRLGYSPPLLFYLAFVEEEERTRVREERKNIDIVMGKVLKLENERHNLIASKQTKPTVPRLASVLYKYDNVPEEINKLRCRVNYHALKFLPETERMADILVSRMHNRTGAPHPYMALHLRFEKGMVGMSFCDYVGTREEKAALRAYRKKEWPKRFKNDTIMWKEGLRKRKEGRCPMEPGEVALVLMAMGYPKDSQIYVASGAVYGGENRMAPLRNMYPNLVRKDDLATKEELAPFYKHVTSLAAIDFLVCLKSDVFVMTHGGNFAKLIIGARRYWGHHSKSIKPHKGLMAKILGDPDLGWPAFVEEVALMHEGRTGLPEPTFPVYDIYENPLSHCMCRVGK